MGPRRRVTAAILSAAILSSAAVGSVAAHDQTATYRVTIVNLTGGQALTPPLLAIHRNPVDVFSVGRPASFGVKEIAENGNLAPLQMSLAATRGVVAVAAAAAPLVPVGSPGQTMHGFTNTVTMEITADRSVRRISWVSMLICTNDGFTGVDDLRLPNHVGGTVASFTDAYDAGTEMNTEAFMDIVPPCQGLIGPSGDPGTGMSDPALAEGGVILHHAGIVGGSDLIPAVHGWTAPVALITIERIK